MPGTILIGVDVESASEASAGYARYGAEMLAQEATPATWYVTGSTLERYPSLFAELDRAGTVDIQSHTYSHLLLKTVCIEVPPGRTVHGKTDWYIQPGGTNEEIDTDLDRCQKLFEDVLGRRAFGLTCPWNYYRGLMDRLDLLEIVRSHGFRFLRAFGRNEKDGQPTPLEWQPFFYAPQGFGDMLEIFIHDYQDAFYFIQFNALTDARTYPDHLRKVADRVASDNLVWSLATHDHGCADRESFEQKQFWLRELIRYAKSLGIRFMTGSEYYRERIEDSG
ncbi:MAG: polysaccharide deacetylase family protein [Armatimonadetes bacterium]|nr:polysaccharide deacetylase family protein [Armatimonadota bacterium]